MSRTQRWGSHCTTLWGGVLVHAQSLAPLGLGDKRTRTQSSHSGVIQGDYSDCSAISSRVSSVPLTQCLPVLSLQGVPFLKCRSQARLLFLLYCSTQPSCNPAGMNWQKKFQPFTCLYIFLLLYAFSRQQISIRLFFLLKFGLVQKTSQDKTRRGRPRW